MVALFNCKNARKALMNYYYPIEKQKGFTQFCFDLRNREGYHGDTL
jgi:hypothetical protein